MKTPFFTVILFMITLTMCGNSSSFDKYSGRSRNIIDQLYQKAIDENDALEKTEESYRQLVSNSQKVHQNWADYDQYFSQYMEMAGHAIENLGDSSLKAVVSKSMKAYESNYNQSTDKIKNADKKLQENLYAAYRHYNAYKLIVSKSEMDKYLSKNKPKLDAFNEANKSVKSQTNAFNKTIVN